MDYGKYKYQQKKKSHGNRSWRTARAVRARTSAAQPTAQRLRYCRPGVRNAIVAISTAISTVTAS